MAGLESAGNPKIKERRIPKSAREVQNLAPAEQQITAEQLVREAHEAQIEISKPPPETQIATAEELEDYKTRKRIEFENNLRRNSVSVGVWMRYALWEQEQQEFARARSIYERVLNNHYQNHSVWLKYAEMEMKNGFVNRARNVWDRAVTLLPRVDQLWYKYAFMEEKLRNYDGSRRIFARWMQFKPGPKAWMNYVNLEMRIAGRREDKMARARKVFQAWVRCHPELDTFLKYAKWEKQRGNLQESREVYTECLQILGDTVHEPKYFIDFTEMEIEAGETERARKIFQYSLDHVPRNAAQDLFKKYMAFEKQYGNRNEIEDVILNKRRFEYEEKLQENEHNYDVWFDFIQLEIENGDTDVIRETFERAISFIPPVQDKQHWRRYIYLWIKYVIYEELVTKDYDRVRLIYDKCIKDVIPHEQFTFGKIWIMYAEFELRRRNLTRAKQIFGNAIGETSKRNVLKKYRDVLKQLKETENVRKCYQKWLQLYPEDVEGWLDFCNFEKTLQEFDRVRAILNIAINQDQLDSPEAVWQFYIQFEIDQENYTQTRKLYNALLERTKHVRVWVAFAMFECSVEEFKNARTIFVQAEEYFRLDADLENTKDERVELLSAWLEFEGEFGDEEQKERVDKKQPKKVRRKRSVYDADGNIVGEEQYYDYIFPEEDKIQDNFNLLNLAKQWKSKQIETVENAI